MNIKKIGIVVAGLIVIATGFFLVAPQLFKKQIQEAVLELCQEYITTEVKMDDLSISFFKNFPHLSVSLENLSIQAPQTFGDLKTVQTQSVDLGIDLLSLFGDQIQFTQLHINHGKFNVVTDSLGNFSFAIFKTSDEPSEDTPFDLVLNKIYIKNCDILYQDDTSKIKIETKHTSISGDVQVTDQYIDFDTQADIASTWVSMDEMILVDKKPLKGSINSRVYLDPMKVEFRENNLRLAQLPLQITGGLNILENAIDFDLHIDTSNASLAELFSLVPTDFQKWYEGMTFEGTITIGVQLVGVMQEAVSNPNLTIDWDIQNGKIAAKEYLKQPVKNLFAKAQLTMPSLEADSLAIQIDHFAFEQGNGFAKGKALYKMPMYIDAAIQSQLDVTELWKTLAIESMKLGGKVSVDAKVKGDYTTIQRKTASGKMISEIASIPTFDVDIQWRNGFFQWIDMPMPLEAVSFDLKAKNTDGNYLHTAVDMQNIDIKTKRNFIKGKIKVENLQDYNMDTRVEAFVDLVEIKNIFPVKSVDFAGQLTIDAKAKGRLNLEKGYIPQVYSVVKLTNGYLKYVDLPDLPLENIQLETHITSPKGSMNDLRIKVLPISFVLGGESFHLDANLFNFNNLSFDIGSKGKLNLGNIYKVFKVEGWDVEGALETDLKIRGKGGADDPSSIRNRGFVLLKDVHIKSDDFPHDFVFTQGTFRFYKNQIKMEDVKMKYEKQTYFLNGYLENYINYLLTNKATLRGAFDVTTDFMDVNSFMSQASSSNGTKSVPKSSGVVLIPDHIDFKLSAKAKKVRFNDMELKDVNALAHVFDKKLTLDETHFQLIDAPFTFKATYQPLNTRTALFDFDIEAKHFDIQKAYKELTLFREMVSAAENASGQVSLFYQLKGRLNADMFPVMPSLIGGGDLILENIQFQGFKLFNAVAKETHTDALHDAHVTNVVVKSTIANNVITLPRTKFKIAGFRPRVEGQVTLDGEMNIGMRLGLPPFGIIGIPITVKGNADDYKISIGKYQEEEMSEDDEDFEEYKKSLDTLGVSN